MKRHLFTLAIVGALAAHASAVLDLAFTVPANKTLILAPNASGTLSGTITGVTQDLTTFAFSPLTGFTFTPSAALTTYLGLNTLADFNDVIGTITAGATPGTYATVGTVSSANTSDGENFLVQVVPEPSAFAALGLGAVALLRRRRKA